MGNTNSQLTKDELEVYSELTYLSKKEILHAFSRFKEINPQLVNADKYIRIPFSKFKLMPEFQNNPFADKLGVLFSSMNDDCWSFEDFLDVVSVLSENAPVEKKIQYAFRLYDFDGDGFLSRGDIAEMTRRLLGGNRLTETEMTSLQDKIMQEADLDKDNLLSPAEFEHMLMKCPDFLHTFSVRM